MMQKFDSRYEIPDQSYFSRTAVPELYAATKEKVAKEVSAVKFFASTTDLWSSIDLKPYISFTLQFIDDDFKLRSRCLCTSFLPQDHTGEVIADMLEATMEEWNLSPSQQVCITTDSGSNITAAANRLEWTRISCFGHNLHLAITKALDKDRRCSRALGIAHKIVSAFSTSWKRRRDLTQAQVDFNLPQHSLVSVSMQYALKK